jgi:hypothetical protein
MLDTGYRDKGQRTIDISKVQGIDIREHPWQKMMGDKKPSPEPLAGLVPFDNFYVHFKDIRKFIDFRELLDQWGTNLMRGYEVNSRDYFLKERYEKQLCLRSSQLAKAFGPAVVRSMAITGSDGYLREGTDLTVIFHVKNQKLFLAAVEPFLQAARTEFGNQLKESKSTHGDVDIESYVTPLREVSLHRACLCQFVVYSNSPVALQRVLDAHEGRLKSLAESLDFQYMRTVFRLEDEREEGFAFLSDAFIRQLVGPASKIKEKRRLEALTSLAMTTHAAMFTAWETGKLPASHQALLAASALKPEEIYVPDGKGVTWDAGRQVAISDVYNTMHFPTPLVELPIDKITDNEEQEYRKFRTEYIQLWRQYFDPVGVRFALNDRRVRLETYILPLIRSREYDFLRQFAQSAPATFDSSRFLPITLIQGTLCLSPWIKGFAEQQVFGGRAGIGDWLLIRLDDSPMFTKLAEVAVQQEFDPQSYNLLQAEFSNQIEKFPITLGIQLKDPKEFNRALAALEKDNLLGNFRHERVEPYKGVAIRRAIPNNGPSVYHAQVEDAWYISLSLDSLKRQIDHSIAPGERGRVSAPKTEHGRASAPSETMFQFNGSIYLAPAAAKKAGEALRYYLEWATHRRALVNCSIWHPLYRCGLVADVSPDKVKQATAMRYLGFVPVSPDGAAYSYDATMDEVVNRRHGTPRQPKWHGGIDAGSPLATLLEQFPTLRADLTFKEDGVNTVITMQRKTGGAK